MPQSGVDQSDRQDFAKSVFLDENGISSATTLRIAVFCLDECEEKLTKKEQWMTKEKAVGSSEFETSKSRKYQSTIFETIVF
jgi:hypothetical protein